MQRKTLYLAAAAVVVAAVAAVVGTGDDSRVAQKPASSAIPAPSPPAVSPKPAPAPWSFAPRRPIDESAPPVQAAPAPAMPGTLLPGAPPPPGVAVVSVPEVERRQLFTDDYCRSRNCSARSRWTETTRSGAKLTCERFSFARADTTGREVFCAREDSPLVLRFQGTEAEWPLFESQFRARLDGM